MIILMLLLLSLMFFYVFFIIIPADFLESTGFFYFLGTLNLYCDEERRLLVGLKSEMESGVGLGSNQKHGVFKDWFSQFRNGSNPWMARYVYALIFLVSNLLAWAVRDYGRNAFPEMESKICLFYIPMIYIHI